MWFWFTPQKFNQVVVSNIFFNVHPYLGEMIQFDLSIFFQNRWVKNHQLSLQFAPQKKNTKNRLPLKGKARNGGHRLGGLSSSSNFLIVQGGFEDHVKIMTGWVVLNKHFLCSSLFGEMTQFDEHIFQMGGSTTN